MVAFRQIQFVETLGRGGFGAVYLADVQQRPGFIQRLAIKILSEEMTAMADIAARQRDEARLLAQLNHDHIVKVWDLFEFEGRPAVLMEYVDGIDANLLLQQGPLPPKVVLHIGAAVACALHSAQTSASPLTGKPLRVVHRDIKPANILISRHGGVKVLDFGVARADFDREGQTNSIQFGTARYMAPEQWLFGTVASPIDIYALGVTLVEIASGCPMSKAPLQEIAHGNYWSQHLARIPEPIAKVLAPTLAFCPDDRPTASVLHQSLLAACQEVHAGNLSHYAAQHVPRLIAARRQQYQDHPLPSPVNLSHTKPIAPPPPKAHSSGAYSQAEHTVSMPLTSFEMTSTSRTSRSVIGIVGVVCMAVTGGWLATNSYPKKHGDLLLATPTQAYTPHISSRLGSSDNSVSSTPDDPNDRPAFQEQVPPSVQVAVAPQVRAPSRPPPAIPAATTATTDPQPTTHQVALSRPIRFGAPIIGAEVYIDGVNVGTTPMVAGHPISYGVHVIEMTHAGQRVRKSVTVGETTPGTYVWRSGPNRLVGQ